MFSEPAVGEAFFGRQDVLELLNKRILALKDGYRQNIAFTGHSLSGKSSIINHFLGTIQNEEIVPVYVEVVKESFGSFANKFIATLLYNGASKLGGQQDLDIDAMLEKSQKLFPKTHTAIKNITSSISRGLVDEAYTSLLGLTSIFKEETRIPCIVILDEFDNMERIGIKNPFLIFGKVIMVQKDTMYIVSSSRYQAIKKILSEKLSLLFGNFEVIKVDGFDTRTASEFIDAKSSGYDIDKSMRMFLIDFTGGNAFYLDRLLQAAKGAANIRLTNHIDKDVVAEAVLETVYNSNGVIHQYLTNFILELLDSRYKELHIDILVAIASGAKKTQEIFKAARVKRQEATKHLSSLIEAGLVSKYGHFYRIEDTVLGYWLTNVYRERKNLLVDGVTNRNRLFRNNINGYINAFVDNCQREPVARLAELFNMFSNDLILIDDKTLRFPHFTRVETPTFSESKFVIASARGTCWLTQPYENTINENDVIDYIRRVKALPFKVVNKILVPLAGMDENAKLLAKELRISIWDIATVNMLLATYGRTRIIRL